MAFARKIDGIWVELAGPFTVGDMQYPQNWPELAAPGELAALGIAEIVEPGPRPTGLEVLGTNVTGTTQPLRIWIVRPWPVIERRRTRWIEAKAVREARAAGGCSTAFGRVDTDPDSQRKIVGAVTGALIAQAAGQPFTIEWTMSDNRVVPHDGAEMIALGVAVLAHINACQAAGTAVRLAIDAAATPEAVEAVDIEAGYPEVAP